MTADHTPLPWELGDLDQNGQRIVRSEHIEICTCWHHSVGSIEQEMEANARLIVTAVNAHADLVAALREIADPMSIRADDPTHQCDIARAALARVSP